MQGIKVLTYTRWYPLSSFGLTSAWWSINQETIFATWAALIVLILLIISARLLIHSHSKTGRYMVISTLRYFMGMTDQTLGSFNFSHFAFATSLFIFIFLCNIINVLFPWVEEPTSDLNTTLALGLTSFVYTQAAIIHAHGITGYVKELATPIFLFPLHILGKLASVVSISFRLFGNIFGSSIIMQMYNKIKMGSVFIETGLLITGTNMLVVLFFGIFEGLIQAYVFFMLTLTYLAIGIQHEDIEDNFT